MLPGPLHGRLPEHPDDCCIHPVCSVSCRKTGKGAIHRPCYVRDPCCPSVSTTSLTTSTQALKWPRPGARNQNLCGIGEFQCKDGFLGVCLYGVDQNKHFLETIGLGHLWGTEISPRIPPVCGCLTPHADEIQKAFEDYCLEHSKYEIEEDFAAHRIAAQVVLLIWKTWLRKSILLCATRGLIGRPLMAIPSMAWAYSPSLRTTPVRSGVLCLTRAATIVDVLTKLGYTEDQINELLEAGVVKKLAKHSFQ